MKNLLTRTLTGFFIVLIVLGGLWLHPITFFLVTLTIVIGLQLEMNTLFFRENSIEYLFKGLLLSVPVFLVSPFIAIGALPSSILLVSILLLILISISEIYKRGDRHFESISKLLTLVVYTTIPYLLMIFSVFSKGSTSIEFSPALVIAFFILLWINDTGAYLFGITIGRHKLFERISPRKTWEGFIGGVALTLVAAWLLWKVLNIYTLGDWLLLGLLVSVFASFGDLFESLLKREAGVKDSGSILPGHGGLLDRFDGVTFAFPVFYLYITFFG